MRRLALTLIALVLLCTPEWLHGEEDAPASTAPVRSLTWELELDAPAKEIWKVFTTKAGIEAWQVPLAEVDWRIGGTIRSNYNPQGKIGDATTITQRILAFEPERMFAARSELPEGYPNRELLTQLWGVTTFTPITPKRTRLRGVMLGFGEGPRWDALHGFFARANPQALEKLKALFPPRSRTPGRDVARKLEAWSGQWLAALGTGDNAPMLLLHVESGPGPDKGSLTVRVLEEGTSRLSATTQIWHDAATGGAHFQTIHADGAPYRGEVALDGAGLVLRWRETSDEGAPRTQSMRFDPLPQGALRWIATSPSAGRADAPGGGETALSRVP